MPTLAQREGKTLKIIECRTRQLKTMFRSRNLLMDPAAHAKMMRKGEARIARTKALLKRLRFRKDLERPLAALAAELDDAEIRMGLSLESR